MQSASSDFGAVQWFFDLEPVARGFNWPIHVDGLIHSKAELDTLVRGKASAVRVCEAYQRFAGAVGPCVINALLASDEAFPEVNHSGKPTPPAGGRITLYVDPAGKRVLAETTTTWGMPATLSVE